MIVIEKNEIVINIIKCVRKSNDYASFTNDEVLCVYIKDYQSMDIDVYNRTLTFVVNSNTSYEIHINSDAKSFTKSIIRDSKIDEVLDK